jgi:hypothetical protein
VAILEWEMVPRWAAILEWEMVPRWAAILEWEMVPRWDSILEWEMVLRWGSILEWGAILEREGFSRHSTKVQRTLSFPLPTSPQEIMTFSSMSLQQEKNLSHQSLRRS